jgi:hypothetical protein
MSYKCKIFYFSVEPHSKEVTSKSIDSNDPWTFSGKFLFDSDKATLLFDISFLSFDNVFALLVASWCFRDSLCDTNIPLFKTVFFPFRKS